MIRAVLDEVVGEPGSRCCERESTTLLREPCCVPFDRPRPCESDDFGPAAGQKPSRDRCGTSFLLPRGPRCDNHFDLTAATIQQLQLSDPNVFAIHYALTNSIGEMLLTEAC